MANTLIECLQIFDIYHSPNSLIWYFKKYLFKNINLEKKVILDIGGGIGLISFYGVISGARKAILIEPESAGSGSFNMKNFHLIKNELGVDNNKISLVNDSFQNFNADESSFDIIILHNSINHLDEDACINLLSEPSERKKYEKIFYKLYRLLKKGGIIIILDCSSKNFFNDLNIKNPIAKSIEWNKHQMPEVWIELMKQVGFSNFKVSWSSLKQLRWFGRILFGNRFMAYLTYSHFRLSASK